MSVGLILGPLLGGAQAGYCAAFGLAFAFIGLDLVLRVILVEKKIAERYTSGSLRQGDKNPESIKLRPLECGTKDLESSNRN